MTLVSIIQRITTKLPKILRRLIISAMEQREIFLLTKRFLAAKEKQN